MLSSLARREPNAMHTTLEVIAQIGFATALVGNLTCSLLVVVNMFRIGANHVNGAKFYDDNKNYLYFRPDLLNDEGLKARRKFFRALVSYFISGLILCITIWTIEYL